MEWAMNRLMDRSLEALVGQVLPMVAAEVER
jgi:hypothetical protein